MAICLPVGRSTLRISVGRSTDLDEVSLRGAGLSRPVDRPIDRSNLVERRPSVADAAAPADNRTLILEAARSRLLADGYAGLSTRKVAEDAGVPLSQIHYHFGSKQGLILALLEHENQRRWAARRHVRRGRAALAALRAGLRLPRGRPGLRLRPGAAGDGRRRLVESGARGGVPRAAAAAGSPCSPTSPGRPSAASGRSARCRRGNRLPGRLRLPGRRGAAAARLGPAGACRSARRCDASAC